MFLSDEAVVGRDVAGERNFDFRKEEIVKRGVYHLVRGGAGGGARYLDTPDAANYLNAVSGYLKELRGGKRDPESYYSLLGSLLQSPAESIREDARSDLMYFVQTCPAFDARRLLTDARVDEAVKYWVEHELLPSREKRDAGQAQ